MEFRHTPHFAPSEVGSRVLEKSECVEYYISQKFQVYFFKQGV